MAGWMLLNLTLGILAFAAIGVVLPVIALRRPKTSGQQAAVASTPRRELSGARELAGVGA